MKFAIIGTGGIGGFFGGKLAKSGEDVCFIARGAHLNAMKKAGLQINSTEGSFRIPPGKMTDTLLEIGPCEVILFCVKSYDTETAARQLKPILASESVIISLQNGVDNEEKIQRNIQRGTVYGGVANIYSTITAPGVVTETGGPKMIEFGPLRHPRVVKDQRGKAILNAFLKTGIRAELTDDVHTAIWKKFIFISAVAGLTCFTRLTLGEILAVKETRALLTDAMGEVEAIAKAAQANIEQGYIKMIFEKLNKHDNNTRSSLYHDLTHEKPLEIEALSGMVIQYGERFGISTPIHKTIYAALLPYHLKHNTH
jgi:2-dehydropantoate 2-reductase